MSERRELRFADEDAAITELTRLRAGCTPRGKWTLAQIAWHCDYPIRGPLEPPPPGTQATEAQKKLKHDFIDFVLKERRPPPGMGVAPAPMVPPESANNADVDRLESDLRKLKAYPHDRVMLPHFGPLDIADFRGLILIHLAHHLSFLDPGECPPQRRLGLSYPDEDAAVADIENLRRGYVQAGRWTLEQAAYHLDTSLQSRMQPGPFPPNTPEQDARRDTFQQILASGRLPDGIPAPQTMQPAPDCDRSCVDSVIQSLKQFKTHPGPFAPHRLFGNLSNEEMRRINLIHFAHHLSYLVPTRE